MRMHGEDFLRLEPLCKEEIWGEGGIKARYKEIKTLPVLASQHYGLTMTLSFFPILRALRSNLQDLSSCLSSSLPPPSNQITG